MFSSCNPQVICSKTHSISTHSREHFHTDAVVPSSDHCRTETILPSSDHYCIETVSPSGDHYCIYILVPPSDQMYIETAPPSSDHYGTTKVAPPSDHLHTKRTLQRKLIGEKKHSPKVWGEHGHRAPPPLDMPLFSTLVRMIRYWRSFKRGEGRCFGHVAKVKRTQANIILQGHVGGKRSWGRLSMPVVGRCIGLEVAEFE